MALEHGHSATDIAERLASTRVGHLRDIVYGAIDGAITTFAIVAGVEGAGLPTTVIIALGLANMLADGFSMAASNYSGTKAELDDRHRIRAVEEKHIATVPDGEREELRQILRLKGLRGPVLEQATAQIASDNDTWIGVMMTDEYGLSPAHPRPLSAAGATFLAFVVAGSVPLIPFLLGIGSAFAWATAMTAAVFFAIGTAKSRWSLAPWWRSGLETLLIGAVAAAIAFGVGRLFHV
ncbi:VIT1/CCC1 transporter family protein [Sulfitobacter sabulilitoris]|uniref:VIT family protein n=1 Tax=Sulfitobacter sabulilitoris TaxID=2562655 RepID=A0A5S3PHG0_9RHOB|nr:VIT1/CCC1 transporter family protein [Sulfitobacter sabulilitoris]TMM51204.1 hypothetical protein FDT80_15190 [Sulfitobacter sabulilitoris]